MLRRFLRLIVTLSIAICFVAFAIANREVITVELFPFPYSADIPAFLFAMICFALGIIVAGLMVGFRLSGTKRKLAQEHKRAMALENELKGVQAETSLVPLSNSKG